MNGYKGYQASDASENPERGDAVLSLQTAERMLPLVQRIVDDFLVSRNHLARLQPEEAKLDRARRHLDWPARQRRYSLKEEVAAAEHGVHGAREELELLGVVILDPTLGRVGFPTIVNNRKAFFSWQPGEERLHSWHFAEERQCRPIPPAWLNELSVSMAK